MNMTAVLVGVGAAVAIAVILKSVPDPIGRGGAKGKRKGGRPKDGDENEDVPNGVPDPIGRGG